MFPRNRGLEHIAYIDGPDGLKKLRSFCNAYRTHEKKKLAEGAWEFFVDEYQTRGYAWEIDGLDAVTIKKNQRYGLLKVLVFLVCRASGDHNERVAVATFKHGSTFTKASPPDVFWFFTEMKKKFADLTFAFNDKLSKNTFLASILVNVPLNVIEIITDYYYTQEHISPVCPLQISTWTIKC